MVSFGALSNHSDWTRLQQNACRGFDIFEALVCLTNTRESNMQIIAMGENQIPGNLDKSFALFVK
jgi:hypothetical protein